MSTDLTNWRDPAHNVWGFQNVDKIIRTASIDKPIRSVTFELSGRDFHDFEIQGPEQRSLDLDEFLSTTETDGVVIVKDKKIVYEHYGRTNTEGSKHALFSITKSVTGLLCGILERQGKLDMNAVASSYLPEVKGSSFEDITIRRLLDMRLGLDHEEGGAEHRKASGLVPLRDGVKPTNLHEYIPTVTASASAPVDGVDGPPFKYLSIGADLLGWIIERITGRKFHECLAELIWQPMGAASDAYAMLDPDGNALAGAGLCAIARDVARLGQLLLSPPSMDVVPQSWVEDMLHNGSREAYAAGSEGELDGLFDSVAYRSYWAVDSDTETLMASGANGQILLVDRKNGIVMAKTSSQPERTSWPKIRLTIQAFREFTRLLASDGAV